MKKYALNKKTIIISICCGVIIALIGLVINAFNRQYNPNGITSLLNITIDKNQPQEYIGELDGYEIYVKSLKTDALYYTSVKGRNIPLRDAVNNRLVSVKDWREKAWDIIDDGNIEILRYENYEIAITDGACLIRPITEGQ